MRRPGLVLSALVSFVLMQGVLVRSAYSDTVAEALSAALAAHEAGRLDDAAEKTAEALGELTRLQRERLATFLPPAPDGWSREIPAEAGVAFGMPGMRGTLVQANYSGSDGGNVTLKLTLDSPMVATVGAMLSNRESMAALGEVKTVNGLDFLVQDGVAMAMVAGRVLVQAEGAAFETMEPMLAAIDFTTLGSIGG